MRRRSPSRRTACVCNAWWMFPPNRETSNRMIAMKLNSLCVSLALLACGAVQAACPLLLEVRGAEGKGALMLDRCEVQVEVQPAGMRGQVLLTLNPPAAQRWRDALKTQSALWSAMLLAQASVHSVGAAVPQGVLLQSHSARLLPEPMWLWDDRAATLLLVRGGTASAGVSVTAPLDCAAFNSDRLIFWFGEMEVERGAVVAGQPLLVKGPRDFRPVSPACISGWQLSPGAPAVIDPASGLGVVAANAADGATFTLMAQVGAHGVQGKMRVVDPAQHPLRGVWRQVQEVACGAGGQRVPLKPLHELRFMGNGNFSATWTPFESYIDYSGTYHYDRAKGELQLAVTAGNDLPAQKQIKVRAGLGAEGQLTVSTLPGGSRHPPDAALCEMVFVRR